MLVVAINDDASVQSAEGSRAGRSCRPRDRAELVAALRCVDYVVIFPEPTVGAAARGAAAGRALQGHRLHASTPCPSATIVAAYGGRIAIVGDPKDHSTRDLLARIAESPSRVSDRAPRFLIVRLGSLGDVVHAIPAAAALRARFPEARIDWLVDPRYVELLELVDGLDSRIAVDPRGGSARLLATHRATLRARRVYDAAIDLQGLLKSAVLARRSARARTIGFRARAPARAAARLFYTQTRRSRRRAHVIYKNLALLRAARRAATRESRFRSRFRDQRRGGRRRGALRRERRTR